MFGRWLRGISTARYRRYRPAKYAQFASFRHFISSRWSWNVRRARTRRRKIYYLIGLMDGRDGFKF